MQVRAFRATMVGVSVTLECVSLIVQGATAARAAARRGCVPEGETRSCHCMVRERGVGKPERVNLLCRVRVPRILIVLKGSQHGTHEGYCLIDQGMGARWSLR